jgi:hypothetical protein
MLGIGFILYLLYYEAAKRDQSVYLTVDPRGNVVVS